MQVRGKNVSGNSRYVGRGDNTCGGEVAYTIPEIRTLLGSQQEDAQRCVTSAQRCGHDEDAARKRGSIFSRCRSSRRNAGVGALSCSAKAGIATVL
jgi:hypothetical protein